MIYGSSPSVVSSPPDERRRLAQVKRRRPWWPEPGEKFLCGPLPWAWLVRAGRMHGKTLQVAVRLWHEVGLRRSLEVTLNLTSTAAECGIDRATASRALGALARAGLVRVDRRRGHKNIVTVIPNAPPDGVGDVPRGLNNHQPDEVKS
jgi:hypothetical protein